MNAFGDFMGEYTSMEYLPSVSNYVRPHCVDVRVDYIGSSYVAKLRDGKSEVQGLGFTEELAIIRAKELMRQLTDKRNGK